MHEDDSPIAYEHIDTMTVQQYFNEINYLTDLSDRAIVDYTAVREIVNGQDRAIIELWY